MAYANTYRYALGNPTDQTDPLGLFPCEPWSVMALDWLLGRGARNRTYGDGSPQVADVKRLPPVQMALVLYRLKNADEMSKDCCKVSNLQPFTDYRWKFNANRFIQGAMDGSCAWHFLDTLAINIYPVSCKRVRFVITNNSDTTSFFAGMAPTVYGNVPGGRIHQTYTWEQEAE
jgi:hypothetical protein